MADYLTAEPLFDFERGDFVIINGRPRIATGKDRLRSKISKTLRTELGKYKIYEGTGYGMDMSIIGKTLPRNYLFSEIKRMVTEALTPDDDIISLSEFNIELDGSKLTVEFNVNSTFGNMKIGEVI